MHRVGGDEMHSAGGAPQRGGRVRIFRDASWEMRDGHQLVQCGNGYMQLEYRGPMCSACHWLQFARATLRNAQGVPISGVYQASGSWKRYGEWYVDVPFAHPLDIWYESAGLANRSDHELSMFDAPSLELDPTCDSSVATDFKTFLVCDGQVEYWVGWCYIAEFMNGCVRDGYVGICGAPACQLPEELRALTWRIGWACADFGPLDHGGDCSNNDFEDAVLRECIEVGTSLA